MIAVVVLLVKEWCARASMLLLTALRLIRSVSIIGKNNQKNMSNETRTIRIYPDIVLPNYKEVSVYELHKEANAMEQAPYGATKVIKDLSPEYLDSKSYCHCGCTATHFYNYDGELGDYRGALCTYCARKTAKRKSAEFRRKYNL